MGFGCGYGSAALWLSAVAAAFVNPMIAWVLVAGVWADLLWIASRRRK